MSWSKGLASSIVGKLGQSPQSFDKSFMVERLPMLQHFKYLACHNASYEVANFLF
jgi:hypothetical protein